MATMDGSFPEVPNGFTVYRVIVKDTETGENIVKTKVSQQNAANDGNNGPDDAVAKVMEDLMPAEDFGGDTEERLYAFADRYRLLQVAPECASAA